MDYEKHYNLLIEKHGTWEKPKGVYTERHRKLPGSMGGKYAKGNAFYMSARAHYLAHLILTKIYPKDPSIWLAVSVMSGKHKRKIPSWWYGKAREQCLPYWKERGVKLGKTALERGYLKSAIEAARFSENQKSAARENQKSA